MDTTIEKRKDGWQAKTYIIIGPAEDHFKRSGERRLCIDTSKALRGGLVTRASVSLHQGNSYSHAFGLGTGLGDYSKRVLVTATRCTEKAVREQHAQALGQTDALLAEARDFYAAQEARKAQEAQRRAA